MPKEKDKKKKTSEESADKTVITSIENLQELTDLEAFILFMSGPLQGKLHCLEKDSTVIGRDHDVEIQIKDIRISRKHFKIDIKKGKAILEDLGSTNGTFVNAKRVQIHELQDGDKIQIPGSIVIKFAYGDVGERMFLDEFYQMANFDAVTGLLGKHAFLKRLEEEYSYSIRTKLPLSFLMLDIDFFKKVNDTYGHLAGDLALNYISERIKQIIRGEDIAARYGGEEIAVILRGVDNIGAKGLAERIRKDIESNPMKFEEQTVKMTVSIGASTLIDKNFQNTKELIDAADQRLYKAKETGRNKVVSEL